MLSLADKVEPRFAWSQIEQAILAIPLPSFSTALRFGVSEDDGCRMARARVADDVRRALIEGALIEGGKADAASQR